MIFIVMFVSEGKNKRLTTEDTRRDREPALCSSVSPVVQILVPPYARVYFSALNHPLRDLLPQFVNSFVNLRALRG
jgi:hypothetical protein